MFLGKHCGAKPEPHPRARYTKTIPEEKRGDLPDSDVPILDDSSTFFQGVPRTTSLLEITTQQHTTHNTHTHVFCTETRAFETTHREC